jgi:hypothetical protein
VTTQFLPRLLLVGAVVTALTAGGGTILTFPVAGPGALPVLPPLRAAVATEPPPPAAGRGFTEAEWMRLPAALREQVRLACVQGRLSGPHCTRT